MVYSGFPNVLEKLKVLEKFLTDFSSHGKHMKNERKSKMIWQI